MNDTQDRAKAYSFDLQANLSKATLLIGWKKLKVSVTQYSWSGYTIVVSSAIARILTTGRHATLEFQGSSYKVTCLDSQSLEDGNVAIQLQLVESEVNSPSTKKKKRSAAKASVHLNQKDPILGIASWICFLMLLLILPGWGEGWGTSTYLSDGFQSVFLNTCNACKCILGK